MNQRLFQDAGGTTPAIIAGQPVGLIKRLAGSVDAVQATALSKATLGRWPRSGVRNLANFAQNYSAAAWVLDNTAGGLNAKQVGTGVEGGVPYVDFHVTGVSTASVYENFYYKQNSSVPCEVGSVWSARATIRVLENQSGAGLNGIRLRVSGNPTAAGSQSEFTNSDPILPLSDTSLTVSRTIAMAESVLASSNINIQSVIGTSVDLKFRVKGFMFEKGEGGTPFQYNYGPNDITETGVADLWHLYNDGGDSLNVTLPAGTYGLASIDINRAITVTTITSDGTTPINTLRHERQLDVILRAGAFSSGEEIAIRDYWGRVFA